MPKCGQCHVTFQKSHLKCPAGQCPKCHQVFCNLQMHKCPLLQLQQFDDIQNDLPLATCDGCFTKLFVRKIKIFKAMELCLDCASIPEISKEQQFRQRIVYCHLIASGKLDCNLCHMKMFENNNLTPLAKFELDHVMPPEKLDAVFSLVFQGADLHTILKEVDKCRVLCVACHGAVTHVQTRCGILRCLEAWSTEWQNKIDQMAMHLRGLT